MCELNSMAVPTFPLVPLDESLRIVFEDYGAKMFYILSVFI